MSLFPSTNDAPLLPTTAGPAACTMTREALEQYLRKSDFGAKPRIFNAFFQCGSSPPRCVVCNRMVGEHVSVAAKPQRGTCARDVAPPSLLSLMQDHRANASRAARQKRPRADDAADRADALVLQDTVASQAQTRF